MFEVHLLNEAGMAKARQLQREFQAFLETVETLCAPGDPVAAQCAFPEPGARELALVRTKLEEASFFAKRAMAMQPDNHDGVVE